MPKKTQKPTYDRYFNSASSVLRPMAYVTLELLRRWATFQQGKLPAYSVRSIARILHINYRTAHRSIQQLVKNNFIIPYAYNPHFRNTLYKINFKKVPRMATWQKPKRRR